MLYWPEKDPDEILDYTIDWSNRLSTDTIADSAWSVPTDLTIVTSSKTSTTTTIWLADGIAGNTYTITHTITTAAGRTLEETIQLRCGNR